jgi:low temperature requirement protein LtrA
VATALELFFDLVFVVAIARAAAGLHHAIADVHAAQGLAGFAMVFFAIWWAWMNFTWFASAYDCDDVRYRLAVFVQITGALIMAAGIPAMFEERHANAAVLGGYVVMRLAMVAQWLRAAWGDAARRTTARRYAMGISVLQVAWCVLLLAPEWWVPGFVVLAVLELAVPLWAEHSAETPWHPHHITERYGLMTIIVLGESILAATMAVQEAVAAGQRLPPLLSVITGGLLIVYSMWWIYFDRPVHDLLTSLGKAVVWGYGHYVVFASAAAVGAGIAAAVDQAAGRASIGVAGAAYAVAIPVVIYMMCLSWLHWRAAYRRTVWLEPIAGVLMLLSPLSGQGVLLTGVILAGVIAIKMTMRVGDDRVLDLRPAGGPHSLVR